MITEHAFSAPDYAIIAGYFAITLAVGWWCSRRRTTDSGQFFLAQRKASWWIIAVSYFATNVTTISLMAMPGKTFSDNWMLFGSAPAAFLSTIIVALVFIGALRRLNLTTVFGYLDLRFGRGVRLVGAGLGLLQKIGARASVILLLPSLALSTVSGLNIYASILVLGVITTIYAVKGGFVAVLWTDVLQVGITQLGLLLAFFYIFHGIPGGVMQMMSLAAERGKFHMLEFDWNFARPTVWVYAFSVVTGVFVLVGDQPLMQRMFASSDAKSARKTMLLNSVATLVITAVVSFLGTAIYAFYRVHPDRLGHAVPNDAIFPFFVVNELPRGLTGLVIAGLFASSMGALSSLINACAAIVVCDFYTPLRPDSSERKRIWLARATSVIVGCLCTAVALFLARLGVDSIWDLLLKMAGLVGGGFTGVFALGLLTRRANAKGVIIGALASVPITWSVQVLTSVHPYMLIVVAVASCFLAGYLASLCFYDRTSRRDLRGLTIWDLGKPVLGSVQHNHSL